MKLNKIIHLGKSSWGKEIFCNIEFDGRRLSISGVIGPRRNGDADSCGQINMSLKPESINPNEDWDTESIREFLAVWDRWHLNDMRAGSPDQEKFLRDNPIKGVMDHYTRACKALESAGLQPDSNLIRNGQPYKYGSAWLLEEVPTEVIEYLSALPDTKITPAWI